MPETPGYQPDAQTTPVDVDPQTLGYPVEYPAGAETPADATGGYEAEEPASREQVAAEIAEAARGLFDQHVETTVATLGDKVQAHVRPTIERVVGAAKEAVAETGNLQAQTRQLQEAATDVQVRLDRAEATIGETATKIDERLDEADAHLTEVDERLRARTAKVEELVQAGDRRLTVLEHASKEQIVDAIRELKVNGTEQERRVVRKLELEAQPTHVHLPLLEAGIQAGVPVWLHGEAGSGKSTAAAQAAERHDLPFRFIQTNPTTSEAKMMGFIDAGGNYRPTGLRQIVEHGGVFLFDEIDNGTPAALTTVNSILANGHGEFPDALIKKHADTRFVAAANTVGKGADAQYVGRNRIDAATIDRFAFVPWDIDEGLEDELIGEPNNTPPIRLDEGGIPTPVEWKDTVRAARSAIGQLGIKHLVTPRATLYGVQLAEVGVGRKWLSEMTIFKGMHPNERRKVEARMGVSHNW